MARPKSKHPTDGELEILKLLWELGPASLSELRSRLQEQRPVATTTVATMLKIMLDKGLVSRSKGAQGYRWEAVQSREHTTGGMLGRLIDRAFDGSAGRLVAHLLEEDRLGPEELDQIRRMIDRAQETDAEPEAES